MVARISPSLVLASGLLLSHGCAAGPAALSAGIAPPSTFVAPEPPPASSPARVTPKVFSTEEALTRARAFEEEADGTSLHDAEELAAFVRKHELDEAVVRRLLEAVARRCLKQAPRKPSPCDAFDALEGDDRKVFEILTELSAELADLTAGPTDTVKLLVELDARGLWRAGIAITRVLERRAQSNLRACAPPSDGEVDAARASLAGFEIRRLGRAPRPANEAELADISYLYAAVAQRGASVGTHDVDATSKPLADGHEDLMRRDALHVEMGRALRAGDVPRHARAAKAYLASLGYPGPIREKEDGSMGWHGRRYSFVMRDWARSAEILGDYERSEALYRQAKAGGGPSGTGNNVKRRRQVEGIIRSAEQRGGCRRVVAERLFAARRGRSAKYYGIERLTDAGYDVGRIYSGALFTMGRDDGWTKRVRAIPWFAMTHGQGAFPRLLSIATRASTEERVEAIGALGRLVESRGIDPCSESNILWMSSRRWGYPTVRSLMQRCETVVDAKAMKALVRRLATFAGDADPIVREAVAEALGKTVSPHAASTLRRLSRDTFKADGERCTTVDDQPEVCGPNFPVKRAAEEALEELREAVARRAKPGK